MYTQALSYTAVGVATYLALGLYVQRINLLANHLSAVQTFEGFQTGNLHVTSYQKFDNTIIVLKMIGDKHTESKLI